MAEYEVYSCNTFSSLLSSRNPVHVPQCHSPVWATAGRAETPGRWSSKIHTWSKWKVLMPAPSLTPSVLAVWVVHVCFPKDASGWEAETLSKGWEVLGVHLCRCCPPSLLRTKSTSAKDLFASPALSVTCSNSCSEGSSHWNDVYWWCFSLVVRRMLPSFLFLRVSFLLNNLFLINSWYVRLVGGCWIQF